MELLTIQHNVQNVLCSLDGSVSVGQSSVLINIENLEIKPLTFITFYV